MSMIIDEYKIYVFQFCSHRIVINDGERMLEYQDELPSGDWIIDGGLSFDVIKRTCKIESLIDALIGHLNIEDVRTERSKIRTVLKKVVYK